MRFFVRSLKDSDAGSDGSLSVDLENAQIGGLEYWRRSVLERDKKRR